MKPAHSVDSPLASNEETLIQILFRFHLNLRKGPAINKTFDDFIDTSTSPQVLITGFKSVIQIVNKFNFRR